MSTNQQTVQNSNPSPAVATEAAKKNSTKETLKVAAKPTAVKAPAKGPEKKAKPVSKTEEKSSGRRAKYADDDVVSFERKNPHSKKTKNFKVWEKLNSVTGKVTVEKALAAGVNRGYLTYMVEREEMEIK